MNYEQEQNAPGSVVGHLKDSPCVHEQIIWSSCRSNHFLCRENSKKCRILVWCSPRPTQIVVSRTATISCEMWTRAETICATESWAARPGQFPGDICGDCEYRVCQFISTCRSVSVNTSLMSLCSRLVNMYVKCDSMVWMFQKCFKRWLHEMWHIWRTSQGYFGMYVCLLSACSNLG